MPSSRALAPAALLLLIGLGSCATRSGALTPEPETSTPAGLGSDFGDAQSAVLPVTAEAATAPLSPAPSSTDSAFVAHGLGLTSEQYAAAYALYLAGRDPSPTLENQFRLVLEERLLALAWANRAEVKDGGAAPFDAHGSMMMLEAMAAATLERWPDGRPLQEADVRALYDLRVERYRSPERAQVRLILVPTPEESQDVLRRLAAGEPFGQLAATTSRHESRSRFGEIDPFPRGTYEPAFEDLSFRLPPGEIASLHGSGGVFIIQKVASFPSSQTPYESVREELRNELRQQLRTAAVEELRQRIAP